jgi:hypothetical protein
MFGLATFVNAIQSGSLSLSAAKISDGSDHIDPTLPNTRRFAAA